MFNFLKKFIKEIKSKRDDEQLKIAGELQEIANMFNDICCKVEKLDKENILKLKPCDSIGICFCGSVVCAFVVSVNFDNNTIIVELHETGHGWVNYEFDENGRFKNKDRPAFLCDVKFVENYNKETISRLNPKPTKEEKIEIEIEKINVNVEEVVKNMLGEIECIPEATYEERCKKDKKFCEKIFYEIFQKIRIKNNPHDWGTNFKEIYEAEIRPRILSVEGAQKYESALDDLAEVIDFRLVFHNAGTDI